MRRSDLTALATDAAEALRAAPAIGTVIGERVRVLAVELQGNEWRGLVARVERRGAEHAVSLADLEVGTACPLHPLIARYRALVGLGAAAEGGEPTPPAPRLTLVRDRDE